MTSSHKHSTTGKLAVAGDIDTTVAGKAAKADIDAAIAAHVRQYHGTVPPVEPPPTNPTRPFAAPVTPNKVDVPSAAIASAVAFEQFLATLATGSWIKLPATSVGWTYGMVVAGKRQLLIDAEGFKVNVTTAHNGEDRLSPLTFRDSQDVAVKGLAADGAYAGVPALQGEMCHLITFSGWFGRAPSKRIEVAGFVGTDGYGDGVYVEGSNDGATFPNAEDIWVHHSSFTNVGRNALSLINCDRVWFEDNTADKINYHVIDFEANFNNEQTTNVIVRRNRFGSYASRPGLLGFFAAAVSNADVARKVSHIEISDNSVVGNPSDGYEHRPRGLSSMFVGASGNHFADIKFLRNTSPQPLKPDSFYASYCDGVTVEGVPASSVMTPNCSGVSVS